MEIVKLNRQKLNDFIHSDEYKTMPNVPISFHRAISHINNPRVQDDDTLLILVYETELIGYLGIIPDLVFVNNIPERMAWMSCIWIHPNARGKGIAKKMTELSVELYNNKILATEFTPVAETLYNKLGKFDDLVIKKGVRIFRRSCMQKVLPARYPKAAFLFPFLSLHDTIINLFHDPFLKRKNSVSKNYEIELLEEPDESCIKFAENFYQVELTRRSHKELEWFFNFHWIKETISDSLQSKRYHFSSESRSFKTIAVKISQDNELIAFLIVTVRDKHIKTPYLYVKPIHEEVVNETINNIMCEHNIEILTSYQNAIQNHFNKSISFLNSKSISRKYLQSKGFNLKVTETMLQDGDGDCGFV